MAVDPERIVAACTELLPIAKAARQLLRRKALAANELARAVPGLQAWAEPHSERFGALDIAIMIATGADAYAIVAKTSGTHRTPEQIKNLYRKWLVSRPRRD